MVAYNFNATQHTPEFGVGNAGLPVGEYLGCVGDSGDKDTSDGKGKMMVFDLTPIEGPQKGNVQPLRLNLLNPSQQAVEIAQKQLAALCFVCGKQGFNDTRELHGIPFRFVVGFQKGQEPSPEKPNGGYTEVKKLKFADGREIGQTAPVQTQGQGQGQQQQQQLPPAGGVAAGNGAGGWDANGGGQNPNPPQQNNGQQQQQQNNGGDQAGWNGGGNPNPAPQQQQPQQSNSGWEQGGGAAPQQANGWGNT